jgi:hypothetical protein
MYVMLLYQVKVKAGVVALDNVKIFQTSDLSNNKGAGLQYTELWVCKTQKTSC